MKTPKAEQILLPKVQEYVKSQFGDLKVEPIKQGVSFNYALGDGPNLVLKIAPNVPTERYALQKYAEAGIPVPKIHHFEPLAPFDSGTSILITEYVPNDGDCPRDYIQMGKMLKRIHSIPAEGSGWIVGKTGKGDSDTWFDFLWNRVSKRKKELEGIIDVDPVDFLEDLDSRVVEPRLLHGDFHANNVLMKDGNLAAVIDPFGIAGDPLYCLANSTPFGPKEGFAAFLLKGYGLSEDDAPLVNQYRAINASVKLAWFLECLKNPDISSERRTWCEGHVKRYKAFLEQYS